MATHSSVLAWRITGTGEPGGLPSMADAQSWTLLKRRSSSSSSRGYTPEEGMVTHSNIVAWGIPRTEEPDRLSLWGHKESDRTEAT